MMHCRVSVAVIGWIAWVGTATAQDGSYFLVYDPGSPPRTGAYMSVCMDQAEGIELLRKHASDIRWGVGTNRTPAQAAEALPFFGTPAVVTGDCLRDLESAFKQYYGRELVVRKLN